MPLSFLSSSFFLIMFVELRFTTHKSHPFECAVLAHSCFLNSLTSLGLKSSSSFTKLFFQKGSVSRHFLSLYIFKYLYIMPSHLNASLPANMSLLPSAMQISPGLHCHWGEIWSKFMNHLFFALSKTLSLKNLFLCFKPQVVFACKILLVFSMPAPGI